MQVQREMNERNKANANAIANANAYMQMRKCEKRCVRAIAHTQWRTIAPIAHHHV